MACMLDTRGNLIWGNSWKKTLPMSLATCKYSQLAINRGILFQIMHNIKHKYYCFSLSGDYDMAPHFTPKNVKNLLENKSVYLLLSEQGLLTLLHVLLPGQMVSMVTQF